MPRSKHATTAGQTGRERNTVKVACNVCVGKKTKCDAKRPACSACQKRGIHCVYDTQDEDESRRTAMQRKTNELERENQSLRDLLLSNADSYSAELAASYPAELVASRLSKDEMSALNNPLLGIPSPSSSYPAPLATSQFSSDGMSVPNNPSLGLPASSCSYQENLATDAIIILTALANGDDAAITVLYAVQTGVPWCNIAANIVATREASQ